MRGFDFMIFDRIYQKLPPQMSACVPQDMLEPRDRFAAFIANVRAMQIDVLKPLFREMIRTQNEEGLWALLRARGRGFSNEVLTEGQQRSMCGKIFTIYNERGYWGETSPCPEIVKETILPENLEKITRRELLITISKIGFVIFAIVAVALLVLICFDKEFFSIVNFGDFSVIEKGIYYSFMGAAALELISAVSLHYHQEKAPAIPIRFDERF